MKKAEYNDKDLIIDILTKSFESNQSEYTLYSWKHTRNIHAWQVTKDVMFIKLINRHMILETTMMFNHLFVPPQSQIALSPNSFKSLAPSAERPPPFPHAVTN